MVVLVQSCHGAWAEVFALVFCELFVGLDEVGGGADREDCGVYHVRDSLVGARVGRSGGGEESSGGGIGVRLGWVNLWGCWVSVWGEYQGSDEEGGVVGANGGTLVLPVE